MSDEHKSPDEQPADVTPETEAAARQGHAAGATGVDPVSYTQPRPPTNNERSLSTTPHLGHT